MAQPIENFGRRLHEEILYTFDLGEKIIDIIEREGEVDQAMKADLAEPFINSLSENLEIMAEIQVKLEEENRKPNSSEVNEMGTAMRKIFHEILLLREGICKHKGEL